MAMQRTNTIPRNELGKLTREPRLQKQLEDMSKAVAQDIPDAVEEALDKATEALDLAENIKEQAFLTAGPSVSLPNSRRLTVGLGVIVTDGGSGLEFKLDLQAFLRSLSLLTGNGIVAKTVAGAQLRTIEAGSARVEVMNGDGTTGNPAIDIDEPSLNLANMGGTLGVAHGGTGATAYSAFSAHKNGATQSIPAGTWTQLTMPTEAFDLNGNFATNAWTPPAGRPVSLIASAFMTPTAPTELNIAIFKNGVEYRRGNNAQGSGDLLVNVSCTDVPNGTDVYTAMAHQNSGVAQSVNGSAPVTYFQGAML